MDEKLMIFGREVSRDGFRIHIGTLTLVAVSAARDNCSGIRFIAQIFGTSRIIRNDKLSTIDLARDWLETEARCIAREMLEMVGPLVARKTVCLEPDGLDGRIYIDAPIVFADVQPTPMGKVPDATL